MTGIGLIGAGVAAAAGACAGQTCRPRWSPDFAAQGLNGAVLTLSVAAEAGAEVLLAGGGFTLAGGVPVARIARWDGRAWSALGDPRLGARAIALVQEPSGPALYAGGDGSAWGGIPHLARREGSAWTHPRWLDLLSCVDCAPLVRVLAARREGTADVLYIAGVFDRAGGGAAGSVARWDGRSWDLLAGGLWYSFTGARLPGLVEDLAEHDDGRGRALFFAGDFNLAGDLPVGEVARWDGTSWSPAGGGVDGSGWVVCLASWADAGRGLLVAGGRFASIGGTPARNVAAWDGRRWSALGEGLGDRVEALAVFDDGSGPALYAGGRFVLRGGERGLARWDGARWRGVGGGVDGTVSTLCPSRHEGGGALFVGGSFAAAGGVPSSNIAAWVGCDGSCYADCDTSTGVGVLDALDLACFQSRYDNADPYACDCDTTTGGGVCDLFDFLCFQNAFDAGCP